MRLSVLFLSVMLFLSQPVTATTAPESLSQRDWMINLVDSLGLSFGLPDSPSDNDYLEILSGLRELRYEAEDHHRPTDLVSVNTFESFGAFSGRGWLNGTSLPTKTHLVFRLPLSGRYRISASVRNHGHVFHIGENTLTVNQAGANFHIVELGELELAAGAQEITVDLPPGTSIDYLALSAPPLVPFSPRNGWQLDAPLTMEDLAVCAARLLGLEMLLPSSGERLVLEAENFVDPSSPLRTDIRHLGQPSADWWLRTGVPPQQVLLFFTPPTEVVYDLTLRGASQNPMELILDRRYPLQAVLHSYLSDSYLTTRAFSPEEHTLEVALGSRSGLDALLLDGRRNGREDYLRLIGLPDRQAVQASDLNRLLALLALLQPPR